jgi:hypothetical protein
VNTKGTWLLAAVLTAGLVVASCIDDEPRKVARVLVEAAVAAPLTLTVSTNFMVRINEDTNRREAVPLKADTVYVTGSYDEQFDIAAPRRIYVVLKNEEATPQRVRLIVLLDGKEDYNVSSDLASGETLEYLFVSISAF